MEPQTPPPNEDPAAIDQYYYHSTVDTSRPFSSVKEAVSVFGEKLLSGEIYSSPKPFGATHVINNYTPKPPSPSKILSPSPMKREPKNLADTVRKLEAELEETKLELKMLKSRESETEVAVATLNAELHRNMSKIARAEAAAAGKAATRTESLREEEEEEEVNNNKRELAMVRVDHDSPTLDHFLSLGEEEGLFGGRKEERRRGKKKPIVPLVGDLFSRKKVSSRSSQLHSSFFSSIQGYWN